MNYLRQSATPKCETWVRLVLPLDSGVPPARAGNPEVGLCRNLNPMLHLHTALASPSSQPFGKSARMLTAGFESVVDSAHHGYAPLV